MSKKIINEIRQSAIQFGRQDIVKLCDSRTNDFLLTWQATQWGILPR